MSRKFSILSIMVMMTVTVMLTATVAFATPKEGGNGQTKVTLCHKDTNTITVGEPAVAAHERHGDTIGACEEAPSEGTTLGLTTQATTPVTLGDSISDTATLRGVTSDATGTMTFKLYGPFTDADTSTDTCVDPDAANNVAGNLVTPPEIIALGSPDASGNYVVSSGNYTPTTVGRYQWVVSYSGDANNGAASSECKAANEASVVTAPTTMLMR